MYGTRGHLYSVDPRLCPPYPPYCYAAALGCSSVQPIPPSRIRNSLLGDRCRLQALMLFSYLKMHQNAFVGEL